MAEGYLRSRYGEHYQVFSAGTRSSTLSRYAVDVMSEIGIDISTQVSKSLEALQEREMDVAVILCADQVCPVYPWAKEIVHACFSNPAGFTGDELQIQAQFRNLREEITTWIDQYFGD